MITGLPSVSALNIAKSDFSRHGRPPARPMTPFLARATGPRVRVTGMGCASNGDRRLDRGMGPIALQTEILVIEAEQVGLGRQHEIRERVRRACELQLRLIDMVQVEVGVAEGVHEL